MNFKKIIRGMFKNGKNEEQSKKKSSSRPRAINRSTTSDSNSTSQSPFGENTPSSSQIASQKQLPALNKSDIPDNNQQQFEDDNTNTESDEGISTSSFFSIKQNNLCQDYMDSFDSLHSTNYYSTCTPNNEYNTISSISSTSHLSLEDALFSYISSDSRSEITNYSADTPKIAVQSYGSERTGESTTARIIDSLFDSDYQVGNYNDNEATPDATKYDDFRDTISDMEDLPTSTLQWEKYFVELYINACRAASESDIGYAQAFLMFEFISKKGGVNYEKLTDRAKKLVAFAQYRVGTMLYEANSPEYDNQRLALLYLNESRRHGNSHATYYLGSVEYHSGNHERAYELLHDAAQKGYLSAMASFGHYVLFRTSQKYSELEAMRYLNLAADMNHQSALLSLIVHWDMRGKPKEALPYCARIDISKDSPIYGISYYCISTIYLTVGYDMEAFKYMELAAQSNYTKAKRKLGLFFLLGIGIPQNDPKAAFYHIEEASRYGDPVAEIILGQFYMEGTGCVVDFTKALQILKTRDHIAAKLALAKLLLDKNQAFALKKFEEIIEETEPSNSELLKINEFWNTRMIRNEARLRVALCTLEGTEEKVQNPRYAISELHDLADRENYHVAQYRLAIIYSDNVTHNCTIIQRRNEEKAILYYLKGADGGNRDSSFKIASMLHSGKTFMGLEKEDAWRYFMCAAQQNHVRAQAFVGVYCYAGLQPSKKCDYAEAFKWLNKAAKKGDETAIFYLANYLLKDNSFSVDPAMIFTNLFNSAANNISTAYFMLGLIAMREVDFMKSWKSQLSSNQQYQEIIELYNAAQNKQTDKQSVSFRFGLECLWKAILLNDHRSGDSICKYVQNMSPYDLEYTNECFKRVEGSVVNRMTLAYAQFLNITNNHCGALKKFKEYTEVFGISSNSGRKARLEICRLVVNQKIGKAKIKVEAFNYLKELKKIATSENISEAAILLGKSCEQELCLEKDCIKQNAPAYFEEGLTCRSTDIQLQIYARMRLVEFYYEQMDNRMVEHLEILFRLIKESKPLLKATEISLIYYYKGLYTLHNKANPKRTEEAIYYLNEAVKIDEKNCLALLELGYIYSLKLGEENTAHDYFDRVEESSIRVISLKHREPETNILLRSSGKQSESDLVTMRLAAAITYGYHNMVHQAVDWLNEIPDNGLAKIFHLYFKMNLKKERNQRNAEILQDLVSPYEQKVREDLSYCERSMLALCNLRLGQCVEEGVMDDEKEFGALEYYQKSEFYDGDNRLLFEKLLPSMIKLSTKEYLKIFLIKGSKKVKNPMFEFELAKFFSNDDTNREMEHLEKAAQLGHVEANYLCGLKQIQKLKKREESLNSKKAAKYFETAARKNHGASYFELSKINIEAGFYEEGIEDMKEADFLGVADASYQLGEYHLTGFFGTIGENIVYKITHSPNESMYYFKKAAALNYPEALVKLGHFYEQAIGVPRDLKYAYNMYIKAIDNDCPNGIGEYALGCWFETLLEYEKEGEEDSHEKKREKAFTMFKKAMDKGNQDALFKVGCYLLSRKVSHVINAEQKGLQLLDDQSSKGITKAMVELARFYESRNDLNNAKVYWMKAVTCLDPEAIEYLELAYKEGRLGLEIDNERSLEYKEKARIARKSAVERQCSSEGFKSDKSINMGNGKKHVQ
ncbi:HCP-like protein [Backusella circina FSU 941]|nr:HCP-like protein [Backusella circina FSU 941]